MENPGTGWPQAAQKAAPSGTLAPHFEQNIVPPTSRSLVAAWLRIVANPEATGQQRNRYGRHLTLLLRWPNAHVAPRSPSHLHSSDFISVRARSVYANSFQPCVESPGGIISGGRTLCLRLRGRPKPL